MAKKESKNENKVKKHFFKDFKAELKKVIWPTPKQLVNNTVAVITIVLITAVIVFVLDVVFDLMNKYGISNLQNIVNEKFNSEEETNTESNSDVDTDTSTETENETNSTETENQETDTTNSGEETTSEDTSNTAVEDNTTTQQ